MDRELDKVKNMKNERAEIAYINKTVMEMKPDEAGTDPDIGRERFLKHILDNVQYIRACGRIKRWRKLSLRW